MFNAAPYGGGVFAKGSAAVPKYSYRDAPAEVLDPIRQVEAVCARYNVPPGAAALQFSHARSAHQRHRLRRQQAGPRGRNHRVGELEDPDAVWDELRLCPSRRRTRRPLPSSASRGPCPALP